ncbi:MAG TPA: ubiquinol-cytochrome c reductase iron-sulfur subunit [Actinomycetota bacterium]|nr:ubiquinol-cytochrome c reductase iron-sulfur subunit [Actinomycetota bacterium]
MSPNVITALVVIVSLGAWALFMAYTALGAKKGSHGIGIPLPEPVEGTVPIEGAPGFMRETTVSANKKARRTDAELQGVSRRQFLSKAWVGGIIVAFAQFGLASLDFLYPRLRGGFGAKITVGDVEEYRQLISAARQPVFIPDGRFWLTIFEGDAKTAEKVPTYKLANVHETGFMALYRKCVHLGCSVPWCDSAKFFECPCHGSKYSVNGEWRDGPAPRSLDQFRVEIVGGKLVVDTSSVIEGAPRGTITSQPQPEGVHCVNV